MDKTLIINQLKKEFDFKNDTEFAEYLGIKQNTLSGWKKRNTLNYELIIEKLDNVNANWLITGKGNMMLNEDEVVSQTSEGNASYSTNSANEHLNLLKDLLKEKDLRLAALERIIEMQEHKIRSLKR